MIERSPKKGSTAVEGPMFSKKTLELLQIIERETIAGRRVEVFKPDIDDRGEGPDVIKSRFGGSYPATAVSHPHDLLGVLERDEKVDMVVFDEVQFMNHKDKDGKWEIVKVFDYLTDNGVEVVFAGLSRDFRGEPFGPMPELLAMAQKKITLTGVCTYENEDGEICGKDSTETQRYVNGQPSHWDDPVILVGGEKEGYGTVCLEHHMVKGKPVPVFDRAQHEAQANNGS